MAQIMSSYVVFSVGSIGKKVKTRFLGFSNESADVVSNI
jgi:hypothetical protein